MRVPDAREHGGRLARAALPVLLAAAALSPPSPVDAQELGGRVVERGSGTPVAGALVRLVGEDGSEAASNLTGPEGTYVLVAPSHGRYRVRVERIGYETWTSEPVELETGASRTYHARVPVRAVEVAGLEVTADDRCRSSPGRGAAAGRLWVEARKAVAATEQTQKEARVQFELRSWHRVVGRRGRVQDETSRVASRRSIRPFSSLPAEELGRDGYVRSTESGRVWFAPDARALLSDAFQRGHCFWVRTSDSPEGWIGLAFEPVDGREVPDVEGVLWLDRSTLELRRLDFSYVNVDLPDDARDVGGSIEFQRLPGGGWIIREWHIQMPRLGRDERHREVTVGYEVDGGEVVAAYGADGERIDLARRATLLGRVTWGEAGLPADGAHVRLEGTDRATRTDSLGRFRLDMVPEGTYGLEVRPPMPGGRGPALDASEVELEEGESREIELDLPERGRLAGRLCGSPSGESTVAVLGQVLGPDGEPVGGARVQARWRRSGARASGGEGAGPRMEAGIAADSAGLYLICDLVPGERVTVRASGPGLEAAETRFDVPETGLVRRDLVLERVRAAADAAAADGDARGTGAVWGRVRAAGTGRPLGGAEVVLAGGRVRAVTDSAGRFRADAVPAGEIDLRVRFLGYDSRARTLRLARGDTLRPTVAVETSPVEVPDLRVEVEGTEVSERMSGFWERKQEGRGKYVTRREIEKTPGAQLHRALRGISGVRVRRCPGNNPPPGCFRVVSGRTTGPLLGGGGGCELSYWVDGAPVAAGPHEGINVVPKEDVEAIEVYSGVAELPARFSGVTSGMCGAVVIWTRDPGADGSRAAGGDDEGGGR